MPEGELDLGRCDADKPFVATVGFEDATQVSPQRRPFGLPQQRSAGETARPEHLLDLVGDVQQLAVIGIGPDRVSHAPEPLAKEALEDRVHERPAIEGRDRLGLTRILEIAQPENLAEKVRERTGRPLLQPRW